MMPLLPKRRPLEHIARRVLIGVLCLAALTWQGATIAAPVTVKPQARIAGAIDEADRLSMHDDRHPFAVATNETGRVADATRFDRMILSLKSDDGQAAGLQAFLDAVHDHRHPAFGQFMDSREFERSFGVAETDLARVTAWLEKHGFVIDEIPAGRRAIVFSGTAAQLRAAFGADMRRYRVGNRDHIANAAPLHLPRALAEVVDGVVSLHDFRSQPMHARTQPVPGYTSGSTHYLAAGDWQTIYNVKPLYNRGVDGSGKSIAILGRSNVNLADVQTFRNAMNLPANTPQVIINGADPGLVSGDHGESDLDLQWAGAVAPAATIKFVTSASTGTSDGITLSAQYAVSNNIADVISLSYGQCESSMGRTQVNFYNSLWQQAATQGISVAVSSGDSGAAGCDTASATTATHGLGVNGLCTSPFSTCVGGTQFADTANPALYWSAGNGAGLQSAISYIPETVWNESGSQGGSGLWASGGGASRFIAKPSWQTTPGVPNDTKRHVPDVALAAATHDGYLVYSSDNATNTQNLYVFGGTSAAAPSFAGLLALVVQSTGYRQGNANPRLYGLASAQAANGTPAYFHQITGGNNSVPGVTGFAASTSSPYYNQATGLGSVDANVLVSRWTDLLPTTSITLSATPNPGTVGQTVSLSAVVSGAAPTGTVQFKDGTTSLGAPVALAAGSASLSGLLLSAGTHSLSASYSGDAANQASVSASLTQTMLAVASVSVGAAPAGIIAGGAVSLTANVSGASPTGTIQFKDGGANLGSVITLAGSTATLNTNTLLTAANHSITAQYSGDALNTPAASAALLLPVSKAVASVVLTATPIAVTAGDTVSITASVSGAAPTGSVQFLSGGTNLGAPVPLASGSTTLATTALAVGSNAVTAIYLGDANNLAASAAAVSVSVAAATGGGTDAADVPTLPEWAMLFLASLLLLASCKPQAARR